MSQTPYDEVIALCEDPDEDFEGVDSHPASAETLERIEQLADSLFLQAPFEEKVWDATHLPPAVSARRLARMTEPQRSDLLSALPPDLAEELTRILLAGVS